MKEPLLIDSTNVQPTYHKTTITDPTSHSQFMVIDAEFDIGVSCQGFIPVANCTVKNIDATFKTHETYYFYDQSLNAIQNYNLRRIAIADELDENSSNNNKRFPNGTIVQRIDNNIYILDNKLFYFKVINPSDNQLYFANC